LNCSDNYLERLPILPKALKALWCDGNRLQILPKLPNGLEVFDCSNNCLQILPLLPNGLHTMYCSNNPLIFITPSPNIPAECEVPENFKFLQSPENYSKYYKRCQTYHYLITHLAIQLNLSIVIISNEAWWFPGSIN
jgi:Leucine-rich repeat (LRR) protein